MSRLSVLKGMDDQERLPIAPHFGTHRQDQGRQIFYETRCPMGVKQHPNSRRGSMESGLQNKQRTIRTDSYVFRNVQLPGHFSVDDG